MHIYIYIYNGDHTGHPRQYSDKLLKLFESVHVMVYCVFKQCYV